MGAASIRQSRRAVRIRKASHFRRPSHFRGAHVSVAPRTFVAPGISVAPRTSVEDGKAERSLHGELAQGASQIELNHTLARADHDPRTRSDPQQTRRGRAVAAVHVAIVAGHTRRSAEENESTRLVVTGWHRGEAPSVVVLVTQVRDQFFAHHPAQRVFELHRLDEDVVLGVEAGGSLRALEIEAEPLLNAAEAGALG